MVNPVLIYKTFSEGSHLQPATNEGEWANSAEAGKRCFEARINMDIARNTP